MIATNSIKTNQDIIKILNEQSINYAFKIKDIILAKRQANHYEILRIISSLFKENHIVNSDHVWFSLNNKDNKKYIIKNVYDAQKYIYTYYHYNFLNIYIHFNETCIKIKHSTQLLLYAQSFFKRSYPHNKHSQSGLKKLCKVAKESIISAALSIAHQHKNFNDIKKRIGKNKSFFEYYFLDNKIDSIFLFNIYAAYRGHIAMPFAKMRLPFDPLVTLKTAPEFNQTLLIEIVAIRKSCTYINETIMICSYIDFFKQEYPLTYKQWEQSLQKMELSKNEYIPWPVHPLSKKFIKDNLSCLIEEGSLHFCEDVFIPAKASLSYRTLIPFNNAPLLKFALPLQLTSSIRSLSKNEIEQAPLLGRQITLFLKEANYFNHLLYLTPEVTGIYINAQQHEKIEAFYSVLFRENPRIHVNKEEIYIPLAGLFVPVPSLNKPLIIELMLLNNINGSKNAVLYFKKYVNIILTGILGLFLNYGVMLEAHQQNLGLVFSNNGELIKLLYQDIINSVIIFKPLFLAKGGDPLTIENVLYIEETTERSILQFAHSVLWENLLPISYVIAAEYNIDHAELLNVIYEQLEHHLYEVEKEMPSHEKIIQGLMKTLIKDIKNALLLSPQIQLKKLLSRIYFQSQTKHWGTVPNFDPHFTEISTKWVKINNILYKANKTKENINK